MFVFNKCLEKNDDDDDDANQVEEQGMWGSTAMREAFTGRVSVMIKIWFDLIKFNTLVNYKPGDQNDDHNHHYNHRFKMKQFE